MTDSGSPAPHVHVCPDDGAPRLRESGSKCMSSRRSRAPHRSVTCVVQQDDTKRSRGRQQRENTAFDCSGVKASGTASRPSPSAVSPARRGTGPTLRVESGRCELEPTPFGQLLGHNRLDKPCPRAKAKEFADRREDGVHRRAGAVAALSIGLISKKCLKRARSGRPIVCQATPSKSHQPRNAAPGRRTPPPCAERAKRRQGSGGSRSPPCGP